MCLECLRQRVTSGYMQQEENKFDGKTGSFIIMKLTSVMLIIVSRDLPVRISLA